MPKKVRLQINGFDYLVLTDEDARYMHALSVELNERLSGLSARNPSLSAAKIGFLAALEYCDELNKANAGAERLRAQMKSFVADAAAARQEADTAKKQALALKKEIDRIKSGGSQIRIEETP
jgi:cell division protein ZapA